MESLKELIDRRNKAVHDAREILANKDAPADAQAKADGLLDEATRLDEQIVQRQRDDGRKDRLSHLLGRIEEPAPRQIPPAVPGQPAPKGGDGAALTVQLGRHTVVLRPGSPEADRAGDDYRRRYHAYLRDDFRGRAESLGLQTGDDSRGGYATPLSMLGMLIKFLDDNVFMRQLATVLPPTMEKSVGALSWDTDPGDADWTAEVPASDISEDDTARLGRREMMPHLLTKLVKLSKLILRNANMDLESFVTGRLGYKFAITEEKAFLTGTGQQQPLGVFVASNNGITTSQDVTASAATAFTADDFINTLYDLKEAYQRAATWLMSREGVKRARKLKTGEGQWLWSPGFAGGQPGLILDRPFVMSEYVPSTYTSGLYVAAVGDFSNYWIQDGLGFEIQRLGELFALKNQVGLLASKQTDAQPVLAEAFRRLKLG